MALPGVTGESAKAVKRKTSLVAVRSGLGHHLRQITKRGKGRESEVLGRIPIFMS